MIGRDLGTCKRMGTRDECAANLGIQKVRLLYLELRTPHNAPNSYDDPHGSATCLLKSNWRRPKHVDILHKACDQNSGRNY